MALKRVSFVLVGLALEGAGLLLLHRLGYINLQHINWRDTFTWRLFFFGFLTAYWLVLWLKFINKIFSKKSKETPTKQTPQPVTPIPSTHAMQPPARMSVQNNTVLTVTPQGATGVTPQASVSTAAPVSATSVPSATPESELSQKEKDINTLAVLDSHLDMMAFKHVALDGKVIDLVYSSDDTAILCKIFSDEHTWTVDTTKPIESCTWTDETGSTQNPCLDLLTQAAILENMESGATIVPAILLVRGTVTNTEETSKYLLQNEIHLVKYKATESEGIRDLHNLLEDKFDLFKEDEEETENR